MILKTYEVINYGAGRDKLEYRANLYKEVLHKDPYWHLFLHPGGGTLRFQPKFELAVKEFTKKTRYIVIKRRKNYDPKQDEYYNIRYLGDDLLPMFHELSVLAAKYPTHSILNDVFERLNHGLVNMAGLHDFRYEADLYISLAFNRVALSGQLLPLPKWLYRIYSRVFRFKKNA